MWQLSNNGLVPKSRPAKLWELKELGTKFSYLELLKAARGITKYTDLDSGNSQQFEMALRLLSNRHLSEWRYSKLVVILTIA